VNVVPVPCDGSPDKIHREKGSFSSIATEVDAACGTRSNRPWSELSVWADGCEVEAKKRS